MCGIGFVLCGTVEEAKQPDNVAETLPAAICDDNPSKVRKVSEDFVNLYDLYADV